MFFSVEYKNQKGFINLDQIVYCLPLTKFFSSETYLKCKMVNGSDIKFDLGQQENEEIMKRMIKVANNRNESTVYFKGNETKVDDVINKIISHEL